jgi:hypothetical protein
MQSTQPVALRHWTWCFATGAEAEQPFNFFVAGANGRPRAINCPTLAPRERIVREEVVTPPAQTVVAPREDVVVAPTESGIVTTGFSTERRCFLDLNGFERCY